MTKKKPHIKKADPPRMRSISMNDADWLTLQKKADAKGMTLSCYIRQIAREE